MDEATLRLRQTRASDQIRASMSIAVMVLARRSAINATKQQLRSRGLKPQLVPHREIVAMADDYVRAHPEIIAEAKETVLRWQAEGVFGPRGGIRTRPARSVRKGPELRTLPSHTARKREGIRG